MRTIFLLITFLLFSNLSQGSSIPFSPIVHSYSVADYNAGIQNWYITQDQKGIMYFGNNKGLLEFDGNNWQLHELPTKGIVRAIYINQDDKIFIGSYEEFGYFERDALNNLVYHSLKDEVKDFEFHNDEIWSILHVDGEIVFQSFGSLFFYNGTSIKGVRTNNLPLNILQVEDTFYSQQIDGGLSILKNKKWTDFLSRKALGNSDVVAALPYQNGALFLTGNSSGYIYQNGLLKKWQTECDADFEKYSINRAVMTKDSVFVIGTISNGIYAVNKNGELLWKENTNDRLQNNTVLGLYCDTDNNIWAALDEGIAYIQNNSLVYYFEPHHRKIGMVYDVLVKNNDAYIASNQGLYRVKNNEVNLVHGLEEQAWFVSELDNQIFCGHNKGTFQISGTQASSISDVKGGMCLKKITINDDSYLLEGNYAELSLYKKNTSGEWIFSHNLTGFSHMISNLEMDYQGYIWAEHLIKGLFRLKISKDLKHIEEVKGYNQLGDIQNGHITLFRLNGRVVFTNGDIFYTYEDMTDSIVPYTIMNQKLAELKGIHAVSQANDDNYWFINDRMAYLVKCDLNNFAIQQRIPFTLFNGMPIEERAKMVYNSKDNSSYLCLNNVIARLETDSTRLYDTNVKRNLWISKIEAINDTDDENALISIPMNNAVEADMNTIIFSLRYPVYNDYTYRVRYKLEGFSEHWVDGSRSLKKRYTRLPFGSYTFKAEIYNQDGVLASTEYFFEVMRPWHLSYIAISCYVLITLGLLLVLQYWGYKSVQKKKDRIIEQQRISHKAKIELQEKKIIELEKEQLEGELKFKSKELSGVLMTNIAHQEFLNSLKEEIQQQILSGKYTRRQLDSLLTMVNNNIVSDEDNWSMFQANFDRIDENFFRNLKQEYPDLTPGDLRFCALLRLNLPTKEIAKLLNISIRGVDAARYRLRKKLNLIQEQSLTDFMINFK